MFEGETFGKNKARLVRKSLIIGFQNILLKEFIKHLVTTVRTTLQINIIMSQKLLWHFLVILALIVVRGQIQR